MLARSWLVVAGALIVGCKDDASSKPQPVASAPSAAPPAEPAPRAKEAVPTAPEQIVCQHVLVGYKGAVKAKRGLTRTKDEAKARATVVAGLAHDDPDGFDELVKKFSDDPSSERLGSTGPVRRADLVKPFADAAFALDIGQVTGVVETTFGFHVIKRTQ